MEKFVGRGLNFLNGYQKDYQKKNNGSRLDVKVVIVDVIVRCKAHSDMLGICPCQMCKCDSKGVTVDETKECETCQ